MYEAEVNNELTILDYLNEDCWRAVLQYVPVKYLIRSERASRRWQGMVLAYLQGLQIIILDDTEKNERNLPSFRLLKNSFKSFGLWTVKLGLTVVATYCDSLENLAVIKENCPNLQALKLVNLAACAPEQLVLYNLHDNFKFLQRVYFSLCRFISDACVSQFVSDKALEELKLWYCDKVTGSCFNSMNLSNLKSLDIQACRGLRSKYFLPNIYRLSELTFLELSLNHDKVLEEILLVLDKMPKLERLELCHDFDWPMRCRSSKPLSRLTRLKHLLVSYQLSDDDLANVMRCCQKLMSLDLVDCEALTSAFVQPLCRHAGARLTNLRLSEFQAAQDDDVLALIRGCPHLERLSVGSTQHLTSALPARAAAARRAVAPGRRLMLQVGLTNLGDAYSMQQHNRRNSENPEIMKRKYEDLIVNYEDYMNDDSLDFDCGEETGSEDDWESEDEEDNPINED